MTQTPPQWRGLFFVQLSRLAAVRTIIGATMTAMYKFSLCIIFWLMTIGVSAAPAEHCSEQTVCVAGAWLDDHTLVFTARNLSDFPLTVTIRVRSVMTDSGAEEKTMKTIAPGSETQLLRYTRADAQDAKPRFKFNYDWGFGVAHVDHDDDYEYRLPYERGKRYRVLQGYGSRFSHTGNEHNTVDFKMRRGTPVHAARDGVVMALKEHHGEGCWEDRCKRTANYVRVLHADGSTGEYYHLLRDGVLVALGEQVTRGQKIGLSGNSGHSTTPHLHFGVYEAIEWGRTRSIAVRFARQGGSVIKPRRGRGYVASD